MYYTYILLCSNNKYYIGFSTDFKKRLEAHQTGRVPQTSKKRPVKLIFYASFASKYNALAFEKYLKSSSGHAFLKKRLI